MIKPILHRRPRYMKPLEQIMCMIYLAQTLTLSELQFRQDLIEKQLKIAHSRQMDTSDIVAMENNICAAVAYQSFPNEDAWMPFIKL